MKVLGISGRYRDAAAAVAVDGSVVAAVSEDSYTRIPNVGYVQTGGLPAASIEAVLATAGLHRDDIDTIAVVNDDPSAETDDALHRFAGKVPIRSIEPLDADVLHAAMSAPAATSVVVCSTGARTVCRYSAGEELQRADSLVGSQSLFCAARILAGRLGVGSLDPFRSLDRLSLGAEPEFLESISASIDWAEDATLRVDQARLGAVVEDTGGASMADAASLNVRVQHARRAIAASFICRAAAVIHHFATSGRTDEEIDGMVWGGDVFSNCRFKSEFARFSGRGIKVAMLPGSHGRALGAAGSYERGRRSLIESLSIGPVYNDTDIKRTLDNCRLDYVYEPDWSRVIRRTSALLSAGKVVGWFQGAAGFGPSSMGTRSVLCDPSTRYARHNMNEYLRQVPLDEPLPVIFASSAAAECLGSRQGAAGLVEDAAIATPWRAKLVSALDWRQQVRVHSVSARHVPELAELLEYHYGKTGVPALIETNLSGPDEPAACTPRDAVRTLYSSAVDALIIGRFILMKDYWYLRSHAD